MGNVDLLLCVHMEDPGAMLAAAEAKLARFESLYSQYTQGSSTEQDANSSGQPRVASGRDQPSPGSTPLRPGPVHGVPMRRRSGPVLAAAASGRGAAEGGVRPSPTYAWGAAHSGGQTRILSMPPLTSMGEHAHSSTSQSSELLMQYKVAAATSEQLASKVLVLQQQLAVQVGSLSPLRNGSAVLMSCKSVNVN